MSKEQERDELHRTIWQIANDLRGNVDGWDFKAYVLGILFYRFLNIIHPRTYHMIQLIHPMKLHFFKTYLIVIILISVAVSSMGQRGFSVIAYQNTDLFKESYIILQPREEIERIKINFNRFSLAFVLNSKNNFFHEIEIQIPEYSKPILDLDFPRHQRFIVGESFDERASSFSFRYELGSMRRDSSRAISYYFSAGVQPYYVQLKYTPAMPTSYFMSDTYFGVNCNVTPRLRYQLSKRFTLELNTPISIFNYEVTQLRQDNPNLPLHQQRHTYTDFSLLIPVYTLRLGLRYQLT